MNSNKQNLINKIIYRSQYRGTREMDIFVSGFVRSIIDSLSINEKISGSFCLSEFSLGIFINIKINIIYQSNSFFTSSETQE